MPRFSAFTRFSHLRFSHKKSHGEKIYDAIVEALGGDKNFDLSNGSVVSGKWYRVAMRLALAKYVAERAGRQFNPLKALDLLPALEWEFGLTPTPTATIAERRLAVAAAAKVARGARRENVERVLRDELGDDFVAYLPTDKADAVEWPASADAGDVGVWNKPGTLRSVYRIEEPVSLLGILVNVQVTHIAGEPAPFRIGSKVALDMGNDTRAESVYVLAADSTSFATSFTKPHDPGTIVVSGRTPKQHSTKRFNLVVLTDDAMNDPEKRRKANRILRKVLRGVSTWTLARPSGVGTVGPFTIGTSLIEFDSIDPWTYAP